MKRIPSMALMTAIVVCVAGCNGKGPAQRDVYSSLSDCMADWQDANLCNKPTQGGGGGGGVAPYMFMGPQYYGNNRSAFSGGQEYTPSSQRATNTASFRSPNAAPTYSAPRPAGSTVSRGGFGRTGSGFSGGS